MPTRRRMREIKPDRVRAIELLAGLRCRGLHRGIMRAHGFANSDVIELARNGLATAHAERVVARSRKIKVARVRITEAGRKALAEAKSYDVFKRTAEL